MNRLVASLLICTIGFLNGCRSTSKLEVVNDFEIDRYLGVWYEAARMPHGFEKNLSSVSANYSFNEDGTIKVLNRGFNDKNQKWEQIEGVAKFKGSAEEGWLKVSFFKPFYASYKILHLNSTYTEAIVTGPSYGYLWILVRDPSLTESELNELVARARALGFDSEKLIFVDQSKNQL
jgi:apolipoprotein D and lipocalin family protein